MRKLNNLLGAGGTHPALPERLVRLLVEVSDTFGGRPVRLVSGYRTTSYFEDSKHKVLLAIDDFAVLAMDPAQAKLAFQVISERYDYRRSTMITTNRPFKD